MKKIMMIIATFAGLMLGANVYAVNATYSGTVTQIVTANTSAIVGGDGSFYIYVDNPDLISQCPHQRVLVRVSDMGEERSKIILALALTALTTGNELGLVVNFDDLTNVYANECIVAPTTSLGASLKNQ